MFVCCLCVVCLFVCVLCDYLCACLRLCLLVCLVGWLFACVVACLFVCLVVGVCLFVCVCLIANLYTIFSETPTTKRGRGTIKYNNISTPSFGGRNAPRSCHNRHVHR